MAHTFFCEKCGKRFDVDERLIGKLARCKDCRHVFPIPGLKPAAPSRAQDARRPGPPPAPSPSPSHDPYPIQDAPVLPARLGKPVVETRKRRRARGESNFDWVWPVTVVALVIEFALLMTAYRFLDRHEALPCVIAVGCFAIGYNLMVLLGLLLCLIVAFSEGLSYGFLFMLVPFYSLYYTITRWDVIKRPFVMTAGGGLLAIVSSYTSPNFLPAIQTLREQARQQQAGGIPGLPLPGEPQQAAPASQDVAAKDEPAQAGQPDAGATAGDVAADSEPAVLKPAKPSPAREPVARVFPPARNRQLAQKEQRGREPDRGPTAAATPAPPRSPPLRRQFAPQAPEPITGSPATIAELLGTPQSARAMAALTAMGPPAEDAVIPHLRSDNWFARKDACQVLKVIGTEKSVAELRVIASKNGLSTQDAREALAEIARRGHP
jgi:hypothetical protein